ncbi:hypothetical protein GCM10023085_39610 [Actinomadura viridis]|uniref:histidine kinase n=1 Tax=Actinomadura viridis TaxID=58110 RepID=A0A931DS09_9ACTN|nr:sensor histidine kinase [Actinomadura viridis]MBG6092756.1 signal transduction histidine kinase [Actinomadura viridis]
MKTRDHAAWRGTIAVDAGLGAVFAAALIVPAIWIAETWGGGYWWFGCAAGAVVCALALVRRRHRVLAAAAAQVVALAAVLAARFAHLPGEPGPAMALALAVLVASAVRTLPPRPAAAVAAGGFAVAVASRLAVHPSSSGAAAELSSAAWLAALAAGLGLRLMDARRRAMAERVRRDERLELARELHDVVAHHVTGIVVATQGARLAARRDPDRLDASLAEIETAGSDALAAMRRVVGLLRDADDAAPASSGPGTLTELVGRFHGHGPAVRLDLPGDESEWPPEVTSTVHRVVQESLTNVARHAAQARTVDVSVTQDGRAVTVEVADDAPPAPSRHHRGGYGLIGMRERVEALGGTLSAGPRPGQGWAVRALLPLRETR